MIFKALNQPLLEGNEGYRAFMDKLAQSNVDEYIDLPMIAVMGDTSSGKSSLLTMISSVESPSSDQLTTRCPIMLQMRRSEERSATVSVQWKDCSVNGGDDNKFEPRSVSQWNWHELTGHIAAAQKHIISKTRKEVARDVVNVTMKGPHCEDLTLIDLPGIVRSTGKGESKNLSEDIQSLLDDYLKNPRCVVLAVHPANVDFHNSQIMAEARKVDPDTKRTIPVLTKPDIIDVGAEENVKELLLGLKTDRFEKGFHMVKGRGQHALNKKVTIEDALNQEEVFFRNSQPWRDVSDRNLFGTKNLRIKLGELQIRLVRDTFPSIVSEMKEKKERADGKLKRLGDLPTTLAEKRILFYSHKESFVGSVTPIILGGRQVGGSTGHSCSSKFHEAAEELKEALERSHLARISDIYVGADVVATNKGQDVRGKVLKKTETHVFVDGSIEQRNVRTMSSKKVGDVIELLDGGVGIVRGNHKVDALHPIPINLVRRDPEWLKKSIKCRRPYRLPIFVDPDVFEEICDHLMEKEWVEPCFTLIKKTTCLLMESTRDYLNQDSQYTSFPELRGYVLSKCDEVFHELEQRAKDQVKEFIHREKKPYSQNEHLYEMLARNRSKDLREELLDCLGLSDGQDINVHSSTITAVVAAVFERKQNTSALVYMAEEMQHGLDAYGKVALKRFIDGVPMICGDMLRDFPKCINQVLSVIGDEELDRLLKVSPAARDRHTYLKRQVETLENGLKALREIF